LLQKYALRGLPLVLPVKQVALLSELISSLLREPGFEEKAVWQYFRTHVDERSQTFPSSVFVESDARFRSLPGEPRNPRKQALWPRFSDVTRPLRAYFYSNLGGTLSPPSR
jgi:hypothetical protein